MCVAWKQKPPLAYLANGGSILQDDFLFIG